MSFPFINIPAQHKAYKEEIEQAVAKVLESNVYINGPEITALEEELTDYIGCKATVACSSGTDALIMALMAMNISPDDEVIMPSFTFVATAETVALLGAKIIFADVNPNTALIEAETVEPLITQKTKAIIPVSLFGQCPEMAPFEDLAKQYNIQLIEDCAQSFGAQQINRYSGSITPIACTSFFPAKPLGCYGDGGAIFVNDPQYLEPLRQIRNHGQDSQYSYARIGINGRLDALQAAILRVKLKHFNKEFDTRQKIAENYDEQLTDKVTPLHILGSNRSVYAQYTRKTENHDALKNHLQQNGIPTAVYYPVPLHIQRPYRENSGYPDLPNTEQLAKEVLSLPMSAFLEGHHQQQVIQTINQYF